MNRRAVLGTLGAVTLVPVVGYTRTRDGSTLSIRFWTTPRAATYDGIDRRIRTVLTGGFDFDHWTLDVSTGGVVDVGTENAADAVTDGDWPQAVVSGAAGTGPIDPVWDVNLLVTDGPLSVAPSGYGVPHVAAVGGAEALSTLDRRLAGGEPLPVTDASFAAQLVLHESGHALGLSHADGRRYERDGTSVVTPMLSLYGWRRAELLASTCRPSDPDRLAPASSRRRLDGTFSQCARRSLREYDGDHLG